MRSSNNANRNRTSLSMNDVEPVSLINSRDVPHSCHWGAFSVRKQDSGIEIVPHPRDSDPSSLLGNIPASVAHPARIARPMIRRGWLENGPGPDHRRGRDEFVAVSWPRAIDLAA